MPKVNRIKWGPNGNDGIDPDQFLGTTDAADLIFKTNGVEIMRMFAAGNAEFIGRVTSDAFHLDDEDAISFGDSDNFTIDYDVANDLLDFRVGAGPNIGSSMLLNADDPVQGGRSVDLRPSDTVYLSNFIFMQNTIELVNTENFLATTIKFDLNNDQGGNIRNFQLATSDAGTFGSYQFVLGFGAQNNEMLAAGVFPFKFSNGGLDQSFIFNVNDGGVPFDIMSLEADGAQSIPQVNINSIMSILGDTPVVYPGTPFAIMNIGNSVTGMNNSNPVNSGLNTVVNWDYTVGINGIFSATNGLIGTTVMTPDGLGAGTDTHSLRGLIGTGQFAFGGSRTMTAVTGLFGQASVRTSGTVTNAIGLVGQVVTVLGGTIVNGVSLSAATPGTFIGGTLQNGTSLLSSGGTEGTISNWNIVATNGAVPSRFEGNLILSQTTETAPVFGLYVNNHQKITSNFGLFFGGTLDADATFFIQNFGSNLIQFGSAGNQTNNSRLLWDFETTANIIDVSGTSSGSTPGIIWDLASTRINGNFGFGVAPTAVQAGYTTITNLNTLRTGNRNTLSHGQLVDIVGTLIQDLKAKGVIVA